MISVLIVEDEELLVDLLVFLLCKEGFEVMVVIDGLVVFVEFDWVGVDIVLFDLMLFGMLGIDVCKQLCVWFSVLVIMVIVWDSEIDKVVGLELGVDDYVIKFYLVCELIVCICVVLCCGGDDDLEMSDGVLEFGLVCMDVECYVVLVNGDIIMLLFKEFDLLEYLMCNSGWVLICG